MFAPGVRLQLPKYAFSNRQHEHHDIPEHVRQGALLHEQGGGQASHVAESFRHTAVLRRHEQREDVRYPCGT